MGWEEVSIYRGSSLAGGEHDVTADFAFDLYGDSGGNFRCDSVWWMY